MKTITANIKEGIDQEIITEAGSILKDGGLVAFPTETVYGLGLPEVLALGAAI